VFLFFYIVNNVGVNPSHLPSLLLNKLLISHGHVIASLIFKSKLFPFESLIRGFQNIAVGDNQDTDL
jgi:hypothetical protein